MKHKIMVPTECDDTTCYPCELRDVRWCGVVRNAVFCLPFHKRLARQKQITTDSLGRLVRLTIRCAACLKAEAKAKGGGK